VKRVAALVLAATASVAQTDIRTELTSVEKQLTALENQFFSAWRNKSTSAVENNIAPDAVSWSEWGIFDKAKQIENQKAANANCTVRSWEFRDVRVVPVRVIRRCFFTP
jgi:hypothetical protein